MSTQTSAGILAAMRSHLLVSFVVLASGCSFDPPPNVGDDDSDDDTTMHDAAPVDCEPNAVICAGSELVTCSPEGEEVSREQCALGCHESGERCNELDPSNGLAAQLDDAIGGPAVVLEAGATINTDDGTITGTAIAVSTEVVASDPVEILVVKVGSLSAQDIKVTGSRALAIVSAGDITLNGVVDLSASYTVGGAGSVITGGGCNAANGADSGSSSLNGGGGGGFGTKGGDGGAASITGNTPGGTPAGTANLVPLRGGCPGGWYENSSGPPSADPEQRSPGAGGGAVQMTSRTRIVVANGGAVVVNGGSAKGFTGFGIPTCTVDIPCGPGAGGGSGGGVLLEAPAVEVAGSGIIAANGGAGHCGLRSQPDSPTATTTPAQGYQCPAFAGGNGAAGDTAATDGTVEQDANPTGGGGGGGAGRIRINVPVGAEFTPAATAVVSPTPTVGVIATR
jgi:hypothetical protein